MICWAISWLRESETSFTEAKYFSVYGASSSRWSAWTKPVMTASWSELGSSPDSTTEAHASALASSEGCEARAVAAWRSPAAVRSRSYSAAISSSSSRPTAASRCTNAQRSSVSTVRPSIDSVPSSSDWSRSSCCGLRAVAAKARAHASWWSLPGSAARRCASVASVHWLSTASRDSGAAYRSRASFSWRCSDWTTPMSDSLPMPESTSER
ncbi:hypothetical protein SCYAM73S_06207 [Streptomyces cyaneofuscatus]